MIRAFHFHATRLWVGLIACGLHVGWHCPALAQDQPAAAATASTPEENPDDASRIGRSLYKEGKYEEAIKRFERGATLYEAQKEPTNAAWMFGWLGDCHAARKDDQRAAEAYAECVKRFEVLKNQSGLSTNGSNCGRTLIRLGRHADAVPYFKTALEAYEKVDNKVQSAWMHDWLGFCYVTLKDDEAAARHYSEAVTRFEKIGHQEGLCLNSDYLGKALCRLKRHQVSIPHFERASTLYRERMFPEDSAWMQNWVGHARFERQEYALAEAAQRAALEQFRSLDYKPGIAHVSDQLGRAIFKQGRYAEAGEYYAAARELYDQQGKSLDAAWMQDWLGAVQRELKDDEAAVKAYTSAVARFEALQHHQGLGENRRELAKALLRQGKHADALAQFRKAAESFEACRQAVDVAYMHGWSGDALEETGDNAGALVEYQEAVRRLREFSAEDEDLTNNLGKLGQVLSNLGRFDEAFGVLSEAGRRAEARQDHAAHCVILGSIAVAHTQRGHYLDALPIARQTLDVAAKAGEKSREYRAAGLEYVATALLALGELKEAEAVVKEGLALRRELYGNEHLETADGLIDLATLCHAKGDYRAAVEHRERAWRIRLAKLGDKHVKTLTAQLSLANDQARLGTRSESERLTDQVLDAARNGGPSFRSLLVYALIAKATAHSNAGRYEEALKLVDEAIGLESQLPAHRSTELVEARRRAAQLHLVQGRYPEARRILDELVAQSRKVLGESAPLTLEALEALAHYHLYVGQPLEAERLFRTIGERRQEQFGKDHPDTTSVRLSLVTALSDQDKLAEAESIASEVLTDQLNRYGPMHEKSALAKNTLGRLYAKSGRWPEARQLHEEALAVFRNALGAEHPTTCSTLTDVGRLYLSQGDEATAERYIREALAGYRKSLGERHVDTQRVSANLLGLVYQKGSPQQAREFTRDQTEQIISAIGPEHPAVAVSYTLQAAVLVACDELDEAERCIASARKIRAPLGDESSRWLADILWVQSIVKGKRGELDQAETLAKQSLDMRQRCGITDVLSDREWLGRVYWANDRVENADRELRAVVASRLQRQAGLASAQTEREQLAMAATAAGALETYLSFTAEKNRPVEPVYDFLVSWKGCVVRAQRQIRVALDDPAVAALWRQLESKTAQIAARSLVPDASGHAAARTEELLRLEQEREKLQRELLDHGLRLGGAVAEARGADVQAALPDGGVLLDFFEYGYRPAISAGGLMSGKIERRLACFVVRKQEPIRLVNLGSAEEIYEAVLRWRKGLEVRTTESEAAAALLAQRIWKPVEEYLRGATLVLVSPDGALCQLPLGALPGSSPGSFLLEEWPIAYLPAPAAIVDTRREDMRDVPGQLLLLGGVDYDRRAAARATKKDFRKLANRHDAPRGGQPQRFDPLPGTAGEFATISALYEKNFGAAGIVKLQEGDANEDAVREHAPNHLYLHLATHGFFAPPSVRSMLDRSLYSSHPIPDVFLTRQSIAGYHPALLSGLALAGANQPEPSGEDGILTAEEVGMLDLRGVQLVVLSACETGLGEAARGEGLLGLQRAFQVAGAKRVVASLWKVPDAATRDLMERFYDNMWNKEMGPFAALREAQLWMLRERGPRGLTRQDKSLEQSKRLPPYFWAAFTFSGDWR